jgi:hypothetical protein
VSGQSIERTFYSLHSNVLFTAVVFALSAKTSGTGSPCRQIVPGERRAGLIARRIPFVTFNVLGKCGPIIHQTYNQLLPRTSRRYFMPECSASRRRAPYHDDRDQYGDGHDCPNLNFYSRYAERAELASDRAPVPCLRMPVRQTRPESLAAGISYSLTGNPVQNQCPKLGGQVTATLTKMVAKGWIERRASTKYRRAGGARRSRASSKQRKSMASTRPPYTAGSVRK